MTHHHDHHHHHDHEVKSDLSFEEKMVKLLEHWIKHNAEHAANYQNWAEKAQTQNMEAVASLMKEAASLTHEISAKFQTAISKIDLETKE